MSKVTPNRLCGVTSEITLTRALVKLKTLDKKIQAAIDAGRYVSICGEMTKPDPEATHARETFQSINDMIKYRRALKSAVIISNATTQVKINGNVCTVAEAIEEKKSIKHKKHFLTKLKQQYAEEITKIEKHNAQMRTILERELQPTRRSAGDGQTQSNEFSTSYCKDYMKMHGLELYDPIQIRGKIAEIDDYITSFLDEVDQVLSEANATTKITVPE